MLLLFFCFSWELIRVEIFCLVKCSYWFGRLLIGSRLFTLLKTWCCRRWNPQNEDKFMQQHDEGHRNSYTSCEQVPSRNLTYLAVCHGNGPFNSLILIIKMVIFHGYLSLPEGIHTQNQTKNIKLASIFIPTKNWSAKETVHMWWPIHCKLETSDKIKNKPSPLFLNSISNFFLGCITSLCIYIYVLYMGLLLYMQNM